MHPLQNGSQDTKRPGSKPISGAPGWFTETGENNVPSYPGADWFNHVIAEFQNMLTSQGIAFDPENDDHLEKAFSYLQLLARSRKQLEQSLGYNARVFPYLHGENIENGSEIPAKEDTVDGMPITHIVVDGNPCLMDPISSGTVSNLTNLSAQVEGALVTFRYQKVELHSVDEMTRYPSFIEGNKVRTYFYNTDVVCDWEITQNPEASDFSIQISASPSLFAVLKPLLGNMLTPEMTGAYGDLVHEDHAAVQACLNFFEDKQFYGNVAGGRKYLIGDTVKGRAFASMDTSCHFKAKDGLNAPVLDFYAQYQVRKIANVKWKGFTVDGNKKNQSPTNDNLLGSGLLVRCDVVNPYLNGDDVNHTGEFENIEVSDILSNNCRVNGIYLGKLTFVERSYDFDNLRGAGNVSGLFVDNYCEYITFTRLNFQMNTYGIRDNGASNLSFLSGEVCNNTEAAIYIEKSGRNTSKKIISGLKINHNKRGIWIGHEVGAVGKPIDHISVLGNQILANQQQGVVGSGGVDVVVLDNFFSGNGYVSPGVFDDIYMANGCKRWRCDNKHINNGNARNAVRYANAGPDGKESHCYHRVDGTFEGFDEPIGYEPNGDPTLIPLNANTNIIQGVFEYWNTPGLPPSDTAANLKASIDLTKIPLGTICINNATVDGSEKWIAVKPTSSSGSSANISFQPI
ncbi:hypothetical protein [Photobacterium frigidiphilum]|uniref:hypothetical protein n=1 Tax=Photobacterium frigidiphilum TaxID=264736 RepID=UPI0018822D52|nr:hypothetical protein [Photobacterium frigidiphilum]